MLTCIFFLFVCWRLARCSSSKTCTCRGGRRHGLLHAIDRVLECDISHKLTIYMRCTRAFSPISCVALWWWWWTRRQVHHSVRACIYICLIINSIRLPLIFQATHSFNNTCAPQSSTLTDHCLVPFAAVICWRARARVNNCISLATPPARWPPIYKRHCRCLQTQLTCYLYRSSFYCTRRARARGASCAARLEEKTHNLLITFALIHRSSTCISASHSCLSPILSKKKKYYHFFCTAQRRVTSKYTHTHTPDKSNLLYKLARRRTWTCLLLERTLLPARSSMIWMICKLTHRHTHVRYKLALVTPVHSARLAQTQQYVTTTTARSNTRLGQRLARPLDKRLTDTHTHTRRGNGHLLPANSGSLKWRTHTHTHKVGGSLTCTRLNAINGMRRVHF